MDHVAVFLGAGFLRGGLRLRVVVGVGFVVVGGLELVVVGGIVVDVLGCI